MIKELKYRHKQIFQIIVGVLLVSVIFNGLLGNVVYIGVILILSSIIAVYIKTKKTTEPINKITKTFIYKITIDDLQTAFGTDNNKIVNITIDSKNNKLLLAEVQNGN